MKYTFSDEEDAGSDTMSGRRSNRQSGLSTPGEPSGSTFTASGRQVRSRYGGAYGESIHSGQFETSEQPTNGRLDGAGKHVMESRSRGRPQRTAHQSAAGYQTHSRKHRGEDDSLDSMGDGSDVTSSGGEWEGGDEEEPDEPIDEDDEDAEMSDDNPEDEEYPPQSLVVSLRYLKSHSISSIEHRRPPTDRSINTITPSSNPPHLDPMPPSDPTLNKYGSNGTEGHHDEAVTSQITTQYMSPAYAVNQNTPPEEEHNHPQQPRIELQSTAKDS